MNEQRRIMELFKERKKSRKKKASSRSLSNTPTEIGEASNDDSELDRSRSTSKPVASNVDAEMPRNTQGNDMISAKQTSLEKEIEPQNSVGNITNSNYISDANNDNNTSTLQSPSSSKKKKKKKRAARRASSSSVVSGEFDQDNPSNQQQDVHQKEPQEPSISSNLPPPPPPGMDKTPPPGFQESFSSLNVDDSDPPQNDNNNNEPLSSPPISSDPPDNPSVSQLSVNPLTQNLPLRYIVIPEADRPNPSLVQSKPSLAVAAAKAFVELYYPHITHGLSSDLATYYTPHAQKSISVGGAHHVIASRAEIMLQLSKFSGSSFVVRGVVSQDTFDGKGAHVLVTGIVQTSLSGLTSFAHSVSLVKKQNALYSFPSGDSEYSFHIHNDALSLLTIGDMMNEQQT